MGRRRKRKGGNRNAQKVSAIDEELLWFNCRDRICDELTQEGGEFCDSCKRKGRVTVIRKYKTFSYEINCKKCFHFMHVVVTTEPEYVDKSMTIHFTSTSPDLQTDLVRHLKMRPQDGIFDSVQTERIPK